MAGRLEGKIAVCTAAGQGIGRKVAETFLSEGATVYASDLDAGKLAGLDAFGTVVTAGLDVTDSAAVAAYAASVPTPTFTPCEQASSSGNRPEPRNRFEVGQNTATAPVSASTAVSR